jgi:hypothetical protein
MVQRLLVLINKDAATLLIQACVISGQVLVAMTFSERVRTYKSGVLT